MKPILFALTLCMVGFSAPIANEVILGDWSIIDKIIGDDTTHCKEDCATVSFLANHLVEIVSNQEQELVFTWIITDSTVTFYKVTDERSRRHKRKEKTSINQIPGIFTITDLSTPELRSISLYHQKEHYTYILEPYVKEDDDSDEE